ncbi:hypothetical protein [Fimbriiglobus ruber]|uniref:hypothetical protein n=1 Tax=Fimbriiglobus ruber TaxID=1908690 RepID=UPI001EE76736|nr:hypothetical protein [Fimbriiglobus ruber]
MTESEWLTSTDPTPMLEFLRGKASDRKLRLFAVACCRRLFHLIDDVDAHLVVEVAERYADGQATETERAAAEVHVDAAETAIDAALFSSISLEGRPAFGATWGVRAAVAAAEQGIEWGEAEDAPESETLAHVHLLRCIFNPFAPPFDPRWQTPTVLSLAQGIYTDRAFDRLPILADALEEASCDNPDLLNHCRSETVHTRGCWALDLLLGRN